MTDPAPRGLRDAAAVRERTARVDDAPVAALNGWVRDLKGRLGAEAIVPWFDPDDGGIDARILWLLEAPGPKATVGRGGSGFISCDNNDPTAENTWCARHDAGVARTDVVHWNVIPYYIGTETKIRAWTPGDIGDAGAMLVELVGFLPRLRSVICGGKAAQLAWRDHAPPLSGVEIFPCPHPSVTNVNTRPHVWPEIVTAWRDAASWADDAPST
ncbi:MAG: uracil-DNA glycosylase [Actinomycetota bacterium]